MARVRWKWLSEWCVLETWEVDPITDTPRWHVVAYGDETYIRGLAQELMQDFNPGGGPGGRRRRPLPHRNTHLKVVA